MCGSVFRRHTGVLSLELALPTSSSLTPAKSHTLPVPSSISTCTSPLSLSQPAACNQRKGQALRNLSIPGLLGSRDPRMSSRTQRISVQKVHPQASRQGAPQHCNASTMWSPMFYRILASFFLCSFILKMALGFLKMFFPMIHQSSHFSLFSSSSDRRHKRQIQCARCRCLLSSQRCLIS